MGRSSPLELDLSSEPMAPAQVQAIHRQVSSSSRRAASPRSAPQRSPPVQPPARPGTALPCCAAGSPPWHSAPILCSRQPAWAPRPASAAGSHSHLTSHTACLPACLGLGPAQVDAFVMSLPLGTDAAAAEVEAAVAARLLEADISKAQLHQRLQKWWAAAPLRGQAQCADGGGGVVWSWGVTGHAAVGHG